MWDLDTIVRMNKEAEDAALPTILRNMKAHLADLMMDNHSPATNEAIDAAIAEIHDLEKRITH